MSGDAPPASERVTHIVQRLHNRGRWWRGAGRVALWTLGAVTFVGALVGGAVLHLDLGPTRRVTRAAVNVALAAPFHGRIELGPIRHVDLGGADIDEVTIRDPQGRVVIRAWGVHGQFSTRRFVRSLFRGASFPLAIGIPRADIDRAEVHLIDDGTGVPTIAAAFEPRSTSPSDPRAKGVRVDIPAIHIGHVDVDGALGVPIVASVSQLRGKVHVTDQTVTVDVDDVPVQLRSIVPGGVRGAGSYHLRAWIASEAPPADVHAIAMDADFSGDASGVGAIARWEMIDDRMKAVLDLPRVDPRQLRSFLPESPFVTPLRATLRADGPLDHVELEGRVEVEPPGNMGRPAVVMLEGELDLEGPVALEASFYARDVDAAALTEGAPRTRVDARGRAFLRVDDAGAHVAVDATTDPGTVAGQPVPAIDAHLAIVGDEISLSARAHEPGAEVDAVLRVLPDASLRFGAEVRGESLRDVPRLRGVVGGALRAEVRGSMVQGVLDARYVAHARGIDAGGARAGYAHVQGTLRGPPPDLVVAAEVTAGDIALDGGVEGRTLLKSAHAVVQGPILRPRVTAEAEDSDGGALEARAEVDVLARSLGGVAFSLTRGQDRLEGKADRLAIVAGGVDARGVEISGEGIGALRGSLRISGGELVGELSGRGLDLARATRLAGFRVPIAGMLDVDVDVKRTRDGRRGHLDVEIVGGEVAVVNGISARLSARFDGEHVDAAGWVRLVDEATADQRADTAGSGPDAPILCDGAIAEVRLSSLDATVKGRLLDAATWTSATGTADVDATRWNLHCLARRFPFVLPISDARGTLTTRLRIRREAKDRIPSVESLLVRTHDLVLVGSKPLLGEPAWASRDIDLQLEASLDGASGLLPFEVKLFDETYLAHARGEVDLDAAIDAGPRGASAAVEDTPFEVTLSVPRRGFDELGTLPSPVREAVPPLLGDFRLDATLKGPLRAPSLSAVVKAFAVQPAGAARDWAPPIDGEATLVYEASTGSAVLSASAELHNATVAQVVAGAEVPYAALRAGGDAPLPWRGGLTAVLNELPMGSFPLLAERGIQGAISGSATLTGLNEAPTLELELELPFVQLGDAYFDGMVKARIRPADAGDAGLAEVGAIDAAQAAPNIADATLEVELKDQDEGTLDLLSHARVNWEAGLLPKLDERRRGGIAMSAQSFRLAAAQPAVAGALSKVDGYLEGELVFEWGDAAGTGRVASADLRVTEGIVYVPAIGQELHGVEAHLESDGPGDFVVRDVVAEGLSGRVTASGRVRLDGLTFDRAAAVVVIDEDEQLPLTLQGVPLGRAFGRLEADLQREAEDEMAMEVRIPDFQLAMQSAGTRSVQTLDDNSDVTIDVPLGPPEEVGRSSEAIRWEIAVDITSLRVLVGDLADIAVRTGGTLPGGRQPEPVVIRLTTTVATRGDVVVTDGSFDFLGKEFELDAGLLRLNEVEPDNPFVNVTAHWEGPDGGRIFLDYVGDLLPITDEKIRLRSDPPRSEREILATLIFGDSLSDIPQGGSSAGAGADTQDGSVANTVGASVASSGLNSILKSTALHRLSADLGTTDEGNFRSGLEYQINDSFSVGAATEQINESAQRTTTGAVQQRQAQRLDEVSGEWRFWRNWSLRGSIGRKEGQDSSSALLGVDVLWQYRY